jgi:hypothetical protein
MGDQRIGECFPIGNGEAKAHKEYGFPSPFRVINRKEIIDDLSSLSKIAEIFRWDSLNGLIQPCQQPERVIGFFNAYREGQRVTRNFLRDIAQQFQNWLKNRCQKWGWPLLNASKGLTKNTASLSPDVSRLYM